jgi:hypothetical protein
MPESSRLESSFLGYVMKLAEEVAPEVDGIKKSRTWSCM